jgi:hypothetical protein
MNENGSGPSAMADCDFEACVSIARQSFNDLLWTYSNKDSNKIFIRDEKHFAKCVTPQV